MLDRFEGNLALALAGYNAGPGNARHWVASFNRLPPDIWLLLKPFDETRRYIIRVVGSYYRYRQLYGSDGR
jgi:soluble lytic murein transglycosylase